MNPGDLFSANVLKRILDGVAKSRKTKDRFVHILDRQRLLED